MKITRYLSIFNGSSALRFLHPLLVYFFFTFSFGTAVDTGPTDTVWYYSGDKNDGLSQFTNNAPTDFVYVTDRFGNDNRAFSISTNTLLTTNTLSVSVLPSGASPRSFSLWVKCRDDNCNMNNPALIYYGMKQTHGQFWLRIVSDSPFCSIPYLTLEYNDFQTFGKGSGAICNGEWRHYVFTFDGVYGIFYIDGTFISSRPLSYLATVPSTVLNVGWYSGHNFIGSMDDLRLYNRGLNSTEVIQLFRSNRTTCLISNNSYNFGAGSPSCSKCSINSTFVSSSLPCRPMDKIANDTIFYFSCDKEEGIGAYASFEPDGLDWSTDRFGNKDSAMFLSQGAQLVTPPLSYLPAGSESRSISLWLKCHRTCRYNYFVDIIGWGTPEWGCPSKFFAIKSRSVTARCDILFLHDGCQDYVTINDENSHLCTDTWNHLAVTFNSGDNQAKLYLNGMFRGSKQISYFNTGTNSRLFIGSFIFPWDTGTNTFRGFLDDIRIFNRALTYNEIISLASNKGIISSSNERNPMINNYIWRFSADKTDIVIDQQFGNIETVGVKYIPDRNGITESAVYFSNYARMSSLNDVQLPYGDYERSYSLWMKCNASCGAYRAMTLFKYGGNTVGKSSWVFISSWFGDAFCGILKWYAYQYSPIVATTDQAIATVCDNKWKHIVITYDGYIAELYVDGTLVRKSGMLNMMTGRKGRMYVGWSGNEVDGNLGSSYTGALDDVRIYDTVLSPDDIVQLYKGINSSLICDNQTYGFIGSPACSPCAVGDQFVSFNQSCRPNPNYGPSDTVYYLSGDSTEGLTSFSSFSYVGISYATDRFGTENAALQLSYHVYPASPPLPPSILPAKNNPRSISVWLKCEFECYIAKRYILTYGHPASNMEFRLSINNHGSRCGFIEIECMDTWTNSYIAPHVSVCDSTWKHVVYTFDGTGIGSLYLDGTHLLARNMGNMYTGGPSRLYLGYPNYDALTFNGQIDDLRIFDRPLNVSEISSLASSRPNSTLPSLSNSYIFPYGKVNCQPKAYNILGSIRCSFCPPGTVFINSKSTCQPILPIGLSDTVWYFSADKEEGINAYSSFDIDGLLYVNDRFNRTNKAIYLSRDTQPLPRISSGSGLEVLPSQNNPRSIFLWIKCLKSSGWGQQTFLNYGSQVNYGEIRLMFSDGSVYLHLYNDAIDPRSLGIPICDNKWHHIGLTYDGSKGILYVDGDALLSKTFFSWNTVSNSRLYIGYHGNSDTDYSINTQMDDIRIYNRALSPMEIVQLYKPVIFFDPQVVIIQNTSTSQQLVYTVYNNTCRSPAYPMTYTVTMNTSDNTWNGIEFHEETNTPLVRCLVPTPSPTSTASLTSTASSTSSATSSKTAAGTNTPSATSSTTSSATSSSTTSSTSSTTSSATSSSTTSSTSSTTSSATSSSSSTASGTSSATTSATATSSATSTGTSTLTASSSVTSTSSITPSPSNSASASSSPLPFALTLIQMENVIPSTKTMINAFEEALLTTLGTGTKTVLVLSVCDHSIGSNSIVCYYQRNDTNQRLLREKSKSFHSRRLPNNVNSNVDIYTKISYSSSTIETILRSPDPSFYTKFRAALITRNTQYISATVQTMDSVIVTNYNNDNTPQGATSSSNSLPMEITILYAISGCSIFTCAFLLGIVVRQNCWFRSRDKVHVENIESKNLPQPQQTTQKVESDKRDHPGDGPIPSSPNPNSINISSRANNPYPLNNASTMTTYNNTVFPNHHQPQTIVIQSYDYNQDYPPGPPVSTLSGPATKESSKWADRIQHYNHSIPNQVPQ